MDQTLIKISLHRLYSNVVIPRNSTIRFEIYDSDSVSFDDFIGRVELVFDENGLQIPTFSFGENGHQIIETELKNKKGEIVIREENDEPSKLKLQIKINH